MNPKLRLLFNVVAVLMVILAVVCQIALLRTLHRMDEATDKLEETDRMLREKWDLKTE